MAHGFKHLKNGLFLVWLQTNPGIEHFFHIRSQFYHIGIRKEL